MRLLLAGDDIVAEICALPSAMWFFNCQYIFIDSHNMFVLMPNVFVVLT